MATTTMFDHTNPFHRRPDGWQWISEGHTWQDNMRWMVRAHGECKALLPNGAVLRLWLEDGHLHQRTYPTGQVRFQ